MSLDLPANVELELERYARAEHVTPAEAASKIILDALKGKRKNAARQAPQASEWITFQQLVPGFALFEELPEGIVNEIAKGSRRIRAEKLMPRA